MDFHTITWLVVPQAVNNNNTVTPPIDTFQAVCYRLNGTLARAVHEIPSLDAFTVITQCLVMDLDASYEIGVKGGHQKIMAVLKRDPSHAIANEVLSLLMASCSANVVPFPFPQLHDNDLDNIIRVPLVVEFSSSRIHSDDISHRVLVRQVPTSISAMGKMDRINATVGFTLWAASLVLSGYLLRQSHLVHTKRVLELGAGLGLPGLICGKFLNPHALVLSDFHSQILSNLEFNMKLNGLHVSSQVRVKQLDWELGDDDDNDNDEDAKFDLIMGSDVVCQPSDCIGLANMILRYLHRDGQCIFTLGGRESRWGVDTFADTMKQQGFSVAMVDVGPIDARLLAGSQENLAVTEEWLSWVGTGKEYLTFQLKYV